MIFSKMIRHINNQLTILPIRTKRVIKTRVLVFPILPASPLTYTSSLAQISSSSHPFALKDHVTRNKLVVKRSLADGSNQLSIRVLCLYSSASNSI